MHIQKRCRSIYYRAEKINCRHAPPVMITLQMHWALIVFITQLLVSQLVTSSWFPAVLVVAARCVFPRGSGVLAVQIQTLSVKPLPECVLKNTAQHWKHIQPPICADGACFLTLKISKHISTQMPFTLNLDEIFFFFCTFCDTFPCEIS